MHLTTLDLPRSPQTPFKVGGMHRGIETVSALVRHGDCLLIGIDNVHRSTRSKGLLIDDAQLIGRRLGIDLDQGWLDCCFVVVLVLGASVDEFAAFLLGVFEDVVSMRCDAAVNCCASAGAFGDLKLSVCCCIT